MIKAVVYLTLFALVVLVGVVTIPAPVAQAQNTITACDIMNDPLWDGYWTVAIWGLGGPYPFYAGDTVYIQAGDPAAYTVMPTIFLFRFNGFDVVTATYPGTLTYVVPTDVMAQDLWIYLDTSATVTWEIWCVPAAQAAQENSVVEVAVPGCDMTMHIPPDGVVGAFMADAPTYYDPDNLINPPVTIEAENTAWVLGTDASNGYYKIVWGCQYLWVPVSSMGPNYDDVWNGTPLPTGIVN